MDCVLVLTATELRCYRHTGAAVDPEALVQADLLLSVPLAADAVARSGQLDLLPDSARCDNLLASALLPSLDMPSFEAGAVDWTDLLPRDRTSAPLHGHR